jgi:hypothetical protein
MQQRLAIARAFLHDPGILLLDEPTTGVDPVSRRDFWKILSALRAEGITIVMTTPYLDEAERAIFQISENKVKPSFYPIRDIVKSSFKTLERLYEKKELVTGFGPDKMLPDLKFAEIVGVVQGIGEKDPVGDRLGLRSLFRGAIKAPGLAEAVVQPQGTGLKSSDRWPVTSGRKGPGTRG